jgi:hypothetical protein
MLTLYVIYIQRLQLIKFKIQLIKSSGNNTDYIVILIFVLSPDGSIYIDGVMLLVWLLNGDYIFIDLYSYITNPDDDVPYIIRNM